MARVSNALPAGFELEGYRLVDVLGSGGFGITYSAVESLTGRKVAIKEFMPHGVAVRDTNGVAVRVDDAPEAANYEYGVSSFRREAQTLVTFRHPNIVSVLRYFEANNTAYLVMEHEEGHSLSKLIYGRDVMSEAQLRSLLMPILDGLEAVHNAGFLHRDLKPDNIYVRQDGSPVLIDFGSARQAISEKTRSLTTVLTPGYAPLEQYSSHGNQGPWTDIYALAACLYLAVTGKRPIDSPARVGNDPVKPASDLAAGKFTHYLLAAIDAGLGVLESERPRSIAEFRALVLGHDARVAETLVTAESTEPARSPAIGPKKRPLAPVVAVAVLLLAGTGVAAGVAVLDDDVRSWFAGSTGSSDSGAAGRVATRTPGMNAAPPPAAPKPSEEELKRKKEEEIRRKKEEDDRIRRERERQERLEKEEQERLRKQREQQAIEEERQKAEERRKKLEQKRAADKKSKDKKAAEKKAKSGKQTPSRTAARSKAPKPPVQKRARSKTTSTSTKTAAKPKTSPPPPTPKCFTFNGVRHCE